MLSACQHSAVLKPSVVDDAQWKDDPSVFMQRQTMLSELNSWKYSAKVGITRQKVREQANLAWRFNDQTNHVRLFGPFGAGQVKIDFDQYGVQLSDNRGVLHRGNSAEELLSRIVGWPIPVNALAHWLFVVPAPDGLFQYTLNESGQISALRQHGWEIQFEDYRDYAGTTLPRKLIATKQNGVNEQDDVVVKLISKAWQW